jgi:RHS repeat-associated protein
MLYSGTDERVQVSVDGTPRRFVHDESGRVIGEYGATGTTFAEHIWLMPNTDEGGWEPLALLGATTLSYVHGDHLGVPVQITDTSGATVNAMQADPFGQRFYTASTSAPRTSLAFPGQIIDIAERHYNLYRDYDPTLGRYLQADPIGLEGGDNVYGYVGGNPVGLIDPDGRRPVDVYIWRAQGASVGHVMVTEANSRQVLLSQFPRERRLSSQNVTQPFDKTMALEGRWASEIWRIDVPNDRAFDAAVARERNLLRWTASPSEGSTQCSIAASRALRAGGVRLKTITNGTLLPDFFANGIASSPGVGVRLPQYYVPNRLHK